MKETVKRALRKGAAALPRAAREAVADGLCADPETRYALMARLAAECGVAAVVVGGDYGRIQGRAGDAAVMGEYARTGRWAPRTNGILTAFFVDGGGSYLDIGANVGLTTIPVAKNGRVKCVAMEPEPANFEHLRANVAANCPHGNVETRREAAFSLPGTIRFEVSDTNGGDNRLRPNGVPDGALLGEGARRTIEVEAVPLDGLAADLEGPLAVKIDTQGAEPFIFAGGRETLGRAGLVVAEFWPYGMARLGAEPKDMLEMLRDGGFGSVQLAMQEHEPPLPPMPPGEVCERLAAMAAAHRDEHGVYCDVVARR